MMQIKNVRVREKAGDELRRHGCVAIQLTLARAGGAREKATVQGKGVTGARYSSGRACVCRASASHSASGEGVPAKVVPRLAQ